MELGRLAISLPLPFLTSRECVALAQKAEDEWGYDAIWLAETAGPEVFALAGALAQATRRSTIGTAVIPVYTRTPAVLAMGASTVSQLSEGRFILGIGSSSHAIVGEWNGIPFENQYRRVRDTLRFLRLAFTGDKVTQEFETFRVKGFRLARIPDQLPPIYLAALRPGMLHLAGKEADGAILNWLSAEDVATSVAEVEKAAAQSSASPDGGQETKKEIVARIFVIPTEDKELARMVGRRMITAYLNVTAYAEFHRWLGRGPALQPMWDAWAAGDRKGALAAIPDEVVDELVVHGSLAECKAHVQRYVDNGVTIPAPAIVPLGIELADAVAGLSPSSG